MVDTLPDAHDSSRRAGEVARRLGPAANRLGPAVGRLGPAVGALALAVAVAASLLLAGCAQTPGYAPGCYLNAAVRPDTRRDLEIAAERFYGLLRARQYETALAEACVQARAHDSRDRLVGAWTSIAEQLTVPEPLEIQELAVAVFPKGTRGPQQLDCTDPSDPTGGRKMITTDQPYQAYLIQTGQVGGQTYNFGSTWFYESARFPARGAWRISSVGTRPRLAQGHDWTYWHERAQEQLAKGNNRNAALLYNLTMDLLVPAPWIKPDELKTLTLEQRKIHADDVPLGIPVNWKHSTGVEFAPYLAGVDIGANGLVLTLRYEVASPPDTAEVVRQAPLLADFIRTTFPEYAEVFHEMVLQPATQEDHVPLWGAYYPFAAGR